MLLIYFWLPTPGKEPLAMERAAFMALGPAKSDRIREESIHMGGAQPVAWGAVMRGLALELELLIKDPKGGGC